MKTLAQSRHYLAQHRHMIIGRSLAAAVAGALPIPILDDWLVSTIRRSAIQRIADAHGVDIDDDALRAIADGPEAPPSWSEFAGAGLAIRILSRQWKKLVVAVLAARRAQAAAREFEIATLFDHYSARRHLGMGLNEASGKKVRALIDRARSETPGGLSRHLFRRGIVAAARSTARAPVDVMNLLSGGRLTNLLSGDNEIEATTEVNETLEAQLRSEKSFLARSAVAIELQLLADQNPYLDDLLDTFDLLCLQAREEEPDET